MELPELFWNQKLSNGKLLSEYVDRAEPTVLPLVDIVAFTNVWKQRLKDADSRNLPDLKNKAQNVLKFLSDHDANLTLLIWPRSKLGALFEPNTLNFIVLD